MATSIKRMALAMLLIAPTIAVAVGLATAVPTCTISGTDSAEGLSGTGART